MHVELETRVAGVEPADAIRWWTDYRPGHVDHAFLPGTERRILSEGEDGVTMEDRARLFYAIPLFRERLTAERHGSHVRFDGENTFSHFAGVYLFEPHPDGGTRVRLMANIHLKRGIRWSDRVAVRLARRILRKDLDEHAEEMRRDLTK